MSLAAETLAMIERMAPRPRVGVVESVNTTTGRCVVGLAGGSLAGVPWSGPAPLAGQTVMVSGGLARVLSPARVRVPEQVVTAFPPVQRVAFTFMTSSDSVEYRLWGTPEDEPWSPEWPTWDVRQGAFMSASTAFPGYRREATLIRYDVAGVVPAGATDVVMRLHLDRNFTLISSRAIQTTSAVVHGITYDPLPDYSADPLTAPEPVYSDTFTGWRPGPMAQGESASFEVPPAWREALLDGSLTGLGFASPLTSDEAWFRSGDAPYQNAYLFLIYTPPPEEEL